MIGRGPSAIAVATLLGQMGATLAASASADAARGELLLAGWVESRAGDDGVGVRLDWLKRRQDRLWNVGAWARESGESSWGAAVVGFGGRLAPNVRGRIELGLGPGSRSQESFTYVEQLSELTAEIAPQRIFLSLRNRYVRSFDEVDLLTLEGVAVLPARLTLSVSRHESLFGAPSSIWSARLADDVGSWGWFVAVGHGSSGVDPDRAVFAEVSEVYRQLAIGLRLGLFGRRATVSWESLETVGQRRETVAVLWRLDGLWGSR